MPLTTYGAQFILDWLFGKAANVPATTLYLALFTTSPNNLGGGTEVSGGAYARVAITNNTTSFTGATATFPAIKANAINFTFPTATADWGTVAWFAFFDAASGGNMVWWGALATPVDVPATDTYSINTANGLILLG